MLNSLSLSLDINIVIPVVAEVSICAHWTIEGFYLTSALLYNIFQNGVDCPEQVFGPTLSHKTYALIYCSLVTNWMECSQGVM